jgi:hypothetical protein
VSETGTKPKKPKKIPEYKIVEGIGENILSNIGFAIHVFQTIWDAQLEFEKFTGEHHPTIHDSKGFQEFETRKWNDFREKMIRDGWRMTPTEMRDLQEGMYKYRKQFRRLTRPAIEAEAERMGA